jgi:hypothetical protein
MWKPTLTLTDDTALGPALAEHFARKGYRVFQVGTRGRSKADRFQANLARLKAGDLVLWEPAPSLIGTYEAELKEARLTDWPGVLALATEAASAADTHLHHSSACPSYCSLAAKPSSSSFVHSLVLSLARRGVPFDRIAVRPDPAGRAFYALLKCAAEALSAQRFAEYVSLGQVPDAAPGGTLALMKSDD